MATDWIAVWSRVFREEIERQAARTTNIEDWYAQQEGWMRHFVPYTARDVGLSPEDEQLLREACQLAFDEVWAGLKGRIKTNA